MNTNNADMIILLITINGDLVKYHVEAEAKLSEYFFLDKTFAHSIDTELVEKAQKAIRKYDRIKMVTVDLMYGWENRPGYRELIDAVRIIDNNDGTCKMARIYLQNNLGHFEFDGTPKATMRGFYKEIAKMQTQAVQMYLDSKITK